MFSLFKDAIVYISGTRYIRNDEQANLQENLHINGTNLNAYLYTLHNNSEKTYDTIVNTFREIFNDVVTLNTPINSQQNTNVCLSFQEWIP